MSTTLPRTYLFVPGDRPERFAKALASGADAVVLDLEDAVLPAAKAGAREAIAAFAATCAEPQRLVLRINADDTADFAHDLALLSQQPVAAVMVPKSERAATLLAVRNACSSTWLLPLVESAKGVLASEALARTPGVQRLVFGTLDYALDMGLEGEQATTLGLDAPATWLALSSRAAGIASPVAGVTPAIDDEALLLAELARARAHGFGAKLCIHPKQVAAIHRALAPSADELAWAQRVLAAAAEARGAVQLDGRMVDKPVIERARRIVARAQN
jgi:citrate lyase subunit beta/citryl-CoA lyase